MRLNISTMMAAVAALLLASCTNMASRMVQRWMYGDYGEISDTITTSSFLGINQ